MATSRSLSCEPGNWTSPCTFLPCSSPFLPTATLIPFFWAAFPERYISAVPGLRTQPVLCTNKMVCFSVHFLGVFVFFFFCVFAYGTQDSQDMEPHYPHPLYYSLFIPLHSLSIVHCSSLNCVISVCLTQGLCGVKQDEENGWV